MKTNEVRLLAWLGVNPKQTFLQGIDKAIIKMYAICNNVFFLPYLMPKQ